MITDTYVVFYEANMIVVFSVCFINLVKVSRI